MRILLILVAGIALAAEPTDTDLKLKTREAQLSEMQTYWKYRNVIAEMDKAHAATEAALAELGKRLNCTPDPQTLTCPRAQNGASQ